MKALLLRILFTGFALLAYLNFASETACAGTIYAASGSNGVFGSLYILNNASGDAILVGPLLDADSNPYGLTGLAFDPLTGVLYGSTTNNSFTARSHLVQVDPATGSITDIGSFGLPAAGSSRDTLSDITITSDGMLYGWAATAHNLYSVSKLTGLANLVGPSGLGTGFGGGGLAANSSDVIYVTPDSVSNPPGTLRTLDRISAMATIVALLSPATIVNAMAFDESGVLWGISTDRQNPSHTNLLQINTSTGAISVIGSSANDLDAIAIQFPLQVPEPATLILLCTGLAFLVYRRKHSRREDSR